MTSWKASTALILSLMVVTYAIVGAVMGYVLTYWFTGGIGWMYGLTIFLTIALVLCAYSYLRPVEAVLRGFGATPASESTEPRLYGIVRGLAAKAGTPMPNVYVLDMDIPNAFALGRSPDKALVAATRPLMDMLTDEELEGVMAHELSHIIHRDTIVNGTARTTARFLSISAIALGGMSAAALAMLGAGSNSRGGNPILFLIMVVILIPVAIVCLLMCLALPSAGAVMRFGVSRSREYGADESAGRITGRPMALASALRKLEAGCSRDSNTFRDSSSANLWIVNPFGRFRKKLLCSLMDTHPSTDDRVKRLKKLDAELSSSRDPPDGGILFSEVSGKHGTCDVVDGGDGFRRLELRSLSRRLPKHYKDNRQM